jgi:hypothetical protein
MPTRLAKVIEIVGAILLLLLFGQVDQQDVPITGQPSKRQSKNKKKKKRNDQTTKQSLRINRTIPTHTKQLASYCYL